MRLRSSSPQFVMIFIVVIVVTALIFAGHQSYKRLIYEKKILQQIITRLQADSRVAEVVVTDIRELPETRKLLTTIKFLEFDALGQPLPARYFTFSDNLIQFQSLVVRFDDDLVASGDRLRGKSVYLFWKAFVLDGANTQEHIITPLEAVPWGYRLDKVVSDFEKRLWAEFWDYALHSKAATHQRIKNAQVEAPGKRFVPGFLYTIRIEHDGGLRIDVQPIPEILKGEKIL